MRIFKSGQTKLVLKRKHGVTTEIVDRKGPRRFPGNDVRADVSMSLAETRGKCVITKRRNNEEIQFYSISLSISLSTMIMISLINRISSVNWSDTYWFRRKKVHMTFHWPRFFQGCSNTHRAWRAACFPMTVRRIPRLFYNVDKTMLR